jgi:hypothetical protein
VRGWVLLGLEVLVCLWSLARLGSVLRKNGYMLVNVGFVQAGTCAFVCAKCAYLTCDLGWGCVFDRRRA